VKYHDNVNVHMADNVLISAEQVTRVNLLLDIIQTVIIAICNKILSSTIGFYNGFNQIFRYISIVSK